MKVVLLYNFVEKVNRGNPEEVLAEKDALDAVNAIGRILLSRGDGVLRVEADAGAYGRIREYTPDVVFNLAEGFAGKISSESYSECYMPVMLEMLGIPYTGAGPLAIALGTNKAAIKKILSYHGVPTPRFQVFENRKEKLDRELSFPLIVKPLYEHGSIGILKDSLVESEKELARVVGRVNKLYRQPALVEEYIDGEEYSVSVLGNSESDMTVLPFIRKNFDTLPEGMKKIYSYEAKWVLDTKEHPLNTSICPVHVPRKLESEIKDVVLKAYEITGCRDYGRIDVRVRGSIPYVLDVNYNPAIDPDAAVPISAKAAGISYGRLVLKIIGYALKRKDKRNI